MGLPVDGNPSPSLLDHLQATREERRAEQMASEKAKKPSVSAESVSVIAAPDDRTQKVLDQLKKIVEKGERERKADQDFLAELRELIRQYDWPWRSLLLKDDFSDGEISSNPSWVVASGNFQVDSNFRLRTQMKEPEQKSARPAGDVAINLCR